MPKPSDDQASASGLTHTLIVHGVLPTMPMFCGVTTGAVLSSASTPGRRGGCRSCR